MVEFSEHIDLFRKLRIPYKKQLLIMAHHIFTEHRDQFKTQKDLDKFLNAVMQPDPERPQK